MEKMQYIESQASVFLEKLFGALDLIWPRHWPRHLAAPMWWLVVRMGMLR